MTASSRAAAQAGARILRAGGNAVDAAVATALASCVADPCNTGLGGYGGHMVIAPPGAVPMVVDFNGWITPEQTKTLLGTATPESGPRVSVVPNVVAGLAVALRNYGSKTWGEVSIPAIDLARDGVDANDTTARAFSQVKGAEFVNSCFAFFEPQSPGSPFRFRQPALARTLEAMAEHGPEWFYDGPIAEMAFGLFADSGTPLASGQWAAAPRAVVLSQAPRFDVAGASLFSAPLGTSGSASMFATVAAGWNLSTRGNIESPALAALWARKIAAAWAYRFGTRDGNRFHGVSPADWVERALSAGAATSPIGPGGHTCHLNACGMDGTLAGITLTHGPHWFGGRWTIDRYGVVMNAGVPVLKAAPPILRDGRAYAVTNMAPTVARLADGSAVVVGCPGAQRIPTIIGLVLARHLAGSPLQDAIAAGRFQATAPNKATVETGRVRPGTIEAFRAAFLDVEDEDTDLYYGPLTAIRREVDGHLIFGLDDRSHKGFGESVRQA
ncbi:MAG: gamma-glutamyltransferase [Methylobacterium organophilum]|nr:gamma-glutamyltransferase [Methylobacterium organophilum]